MKKMSYSDLHKMVESFRMVKQNGVPLSDEQHKILWEFDAIKKIETNMVFDNRTASFSTKDSDVVSEHIQLFKKNIGKAFKTSNYLSCYAHEEGVNQIFKLLSPKISVITDNEYINSLLG